MNKSKMVSEIKMLVDRFPEIPEEMISVYTLNRNLIDETFEMEIAYKEILTQEDKK